uniref:Uncharacterized protein n=1 Tax=Micrurus paraensis TaxID=1970185 RepID=A0A2D4JU15_9SAUR
MFVAWGRKEKNGIVDNTLSLNSSEADNSYFLNDCQKSNFKKKECLIYMFSCPKYINLGAVINNVLSLSVKKKIQPLFQITTFPQAALFNGNCKYHFGSLDTVQQYLFFVCKTYYLLLTHFLYVFCQC